jgi:hypothetical protein
VLPVVFFLTSLTLGLAQTRSANSGGSLIQEEARRRASQRAGTAGEQPSSPGTASPLPPTDGATAPAAPAQGGGAVPPAPPPGGGP